MSEDPHRIPAGADDLPDTVRREIAAHHALYARDPEAAHMWDPIVIGVPGGPVPCLLLHHVGRKSAQRLNSILQYYRHADDIVIVVDAHIEINSGISVEAGHDIAVAARQRVMRRHRVLNVMTHVDPCGRPDLEHVTAAR